MPDSFTPLAFVEGIVEVNTIFMGDERPVVHLKAQRSADAEAVVKNTVQASADGLRYKLIVEPGQWHVWAELGPVKSQPVVVEVQEGETEKVNFVFGRK